MSKILRTFFRHLRDSWKLPRGSQRQRSKVDLDIGMHSKLAGSPVADTPCDEANHRGAIDVMTANSDKETNSDEAGNTDAGEGEHTADEIVIKDSTIDTSRFGFHGMAKLVVINDQQRYNFFVHTKLLTVASPFFRNALQGDWKEADEQCITLPDDLPLVVSVYVNFLYTGNLDIESVCAVNPEDTTAAKHKNEYSAAKRKDDTSAAKRKNDTSDAKLEDDRLAAKREQMLAAQLFLFSDKVHDTQAKNEAVRAMHRCVYKARTVASWIVPSVKVIREIYNNTLPGCVMRKLMVDVLAHWGDPAFLPSSDRVDGEFLFDVATASMKISKAASKLIPETDIENYLENVE